MPSTFLWLWAVEEYGLCGLRAEARFGFGGSHCVFPGNVGFEDTEQIFFRRLERSIARGSATRRRHVDKSVNMQCGDHRTL
jgi:hypothetical protein